MKTKNNDFYRDLDRYKGRAGYCNCTTLAIFFIVLVIILEFFVFSFVRGLRFNPKSPDIKIPTGVGTQLQKSPISESRDSVYISQGQLCLIISKNKKGDYVCSISEEGIEISGKIGYLLPSNSSILLFPTVSSGNLDFSVKRVAVGKVGVPSSLSLGIGALVEKSIKGELQNQVEFQAVELSEGVMKLVIQSVR